MKLNKKVGFIFLIFAITFSPVSYSNIFVQSQTVDPEYISGYQEWTQSRPVNGPVTVNAGATLVIKNGVTLTFNSGNIIVKGNLIVSGTVKDPVKFQRVEDAGYYSIRVDSDGKLIMRNSDMSGAGLMAVPIGNNSLLNTAYAFYEGGINMNGGTLNVQGSNFHDNDVAISISSSSAGKVIVNRSKFSNSRTLDVYYGSVSSSASADFRYNWWGSSNGPSQICEVGYDCYYDKLDGKIDVSKHLTQENFRDPVIIIPGILGSFDFFGEKKLDPFLHTYDYLYETFKLNGYTPEQKLFAFPYEWRDSNIANAQKLKIKIDEIKQQNNWPKVDIVAHSMGGLLAREYIESGYYGNDVDQLITLGTPQRGAPKDYLTWEGGKIATSKFDFLAMFMEDIFRAESKINGFSDIFDYVRNRPILSIQQLLPIYSYLYDNGSQRIYPTNYPTNSFLETLNNPAGILKLQTVEFDNIVGNLNGSDSTISRIDVIESNDDLLWEHGYPEDFDSLLGDHGLEYGDGDGTVPLESASLPTVDEKIEINAKHGDLPTKAAEEAFKLLTDHSPQNFSLSKQIKDIISIFVYSPIDIQVIAPSGKWVGRNIKNLDETDMIPGAYYTGYDGVDSEFLTIPDPENGEYKIIMRGTDDDTYRVEISRLTENPIDGTVAEMSGEIFGTAIKGDEEEKNITVEKDRIITETEAGDTTAPEIVVTSPQTQNYLNNLVLPINYAVSDDITASGNIQQVVYFDGEETQVKEIDLALQKLGEHTLKITATDEVGNLGEKEVKFTVVTNVDAISKNIAHYRQIGLIADQKTANALQIRIKLISGTLDLIAKMSEKEKPKAEKALIKILNKEIDEMVDVIQGKLADTIKPPAGELLVESLKSLRK
jgi:hypothetical protein